MGAAAGADPSAASGAYSKTPPPEAEAAGSGSAKRDEEDVVDADFEVVDDENKS